MTNSSDAGFFPKEQIDEVVVTPHTKSHASKNSFPPDLRRDTREDIIKQHLQRSNAGRTQVCNRCHNLTHHRDGEAIKSPTLQAVRSMILAQRARRLHIYHVIDAADFPLSIVPAIDRLFSRTQLRSRNNRSKAPSFRYGKQLDLSFVISRADLFAPCKEQVDRLMPSLVQVLREALGSSAANARLGNVYCVSSKREWWTLKLKEDIFRRKEAACLVGKVNVGKSQLCKSIFPNSRMQGLSTQRESDSCTVLKTNNEQIHQSSRGMTRSQERVQEDTSSRPMSSKSQNVNSPRRFPIFPIVNPLPGTTANAIPLDFYDGKGSVVDLPGLSRNSLADCIKLAYHKECYISQRPTPRKKIIPPGQSLLVGDIICITPENLASPLVAHCFLPIKTVVGSTEDLIALQHQHPGKHSIAVPSIAQQIRPAGCYSLKYEITRAQLRQTGRPVNGNLTLERLPFAIYGLDVLIEGCGWVELIVQVRKRHLEQYGAKLPQVNITSPHGKLVGVRKPLNLQAILDAGHRRQQSSRRRRQKQANASLSGMIQ